MTTPVPRPSVIPDLTELDAKAHHALDFAKHLRAPWRRDGRTVWSGEWPREPQAHPVCTYHVDDDPYGLKPPPIGTQATLEHIAANPPAVTIALIARIRELDQLHTAAADAIDALEADAELARKRMAELEAQNRSLQEKASALIEAGDAVTAVMSGAVIELSPTQLLQGPPAIARQNAAVADLRKLLREVVPEWMPVTDGKTPP